MRTRTLTRRWPQLALLPVLFSLALLCISPARAFGPQLHQGVSGQRVRDAQWLMSGHNRLFPHQLHVYRGAIDGRYGPATSTATKSLKYRLGFPVQALNGRFGWRVYALLTGKRKLSTLSLQRRARRLKQLAHPSQGIVALSPACSGAYAPRPYVLVFARRVAAVYGHPLVCTSGYRPGAIVHGTNRQSMHAVRAAADLGTPTYAMNTAVGHAALVAAGMSRSQASGSSSFAGWYGGVNILFHTYIGGNHYDHVHTGEWSWPTGHRGFLSASRQTAINTEQPGAWNVVYQQGLSASSGTALAYAIVGVKRELAYNGFAGQMDVDSAIFSGYAVLAARHFQQANGLVVDGVVGPRTALVLFRKRAEASGLANGIPDHLNARQKTWESANDPAAIGSSGHDFGLPQIYLPSHPDISKAQAISPAFALPWEALALRNYFGQLHDWDAAVAAYNVGLSAATKWLAAGKPSSGGPLGTNGVDLFAVAFNYVRHVRASSW
jgi:peptidoglycan hydrolase-like protein with peptidoglycan-binding domain